MAAARDQAARILRPEPDAAEGALRARRFRGPGRPASRSCLGRDRRAPPCGDAGQPGHRRRRPRQRRPLLPHAAAPKSGKRRLVLIGIVALLALAAAGYGVHYCSGRTLLTSRPTTPMSAPTTPRWARGCHGHVAAILPGDNALVRSRRRDLPDRRRRLPHRGRCRAHQDRDPAGDHRPYRPSGHRARKRGRAGQGAARLRGSRA